MFAMAQFIDMDDSKKLSAPAYQKEKGGRVLRYAQIINNSNFKRFVKPFLNFSAFYSICFSK
jgi:hypothetical protein